jgi:hypothetical protein
LKVITKVDPTLELSEAETSVQELCEFFAGDIQAETTSPQAGREMLPKAPSDLGIF